MNQQKNPEEKRKPFLDRNEKQVGLLLKVLEIVFKVIELISKCLS